MEIHTGERWVEHLERLRIRPEKGKGGGTYDDDGHHHHDHGGEKWRYK